ncbi:MULTISPECIES: threonine/serine exporter family protein [unclassified Sedimentibacter]|uniref:threonine/serine exporter family protein n=1 Tax=unclassified Sedimentibacter TaxID=2649220 RepID=UPI0027E2050C|nr:threonine/serine exporter family protein [Sedimentibacter sp. MB35-C1]WMJ78545.1 threonine/serine exporter family protein [Sedimentibacter sp. MB35-C1]
MYVIAEMFYCFAATLFFAVLMNAPKKTLIYSSLTASLGYIIYEYFILKGSAFLAFFLGTVFVATFGEVFARKLKMPATIFIFPGVIPIVPGLGLYETILAFVQDDIFLALETGVSTILNIGCMAVAMALVSLIAVKVKVKKVG